MKELLVTIASALVEDKSAVQVTVDEPDAEGVVVYHLHVAQEDMGRVIGKQGRIAQSRRKDLRRDRLIQKDGTEMFRMKPSKKSRWDFSAETSALRARFVGNADKPHTCADRSVFYSGRPGAKN